MKTKFFALVLGMLSLDAIGQIGMHPQFGATFNYMYTDVSMDDTGTVGESQEWDYSNLYVDTMGLATFRYRLPSEAELAIEPEIDFVAETIAGETNYYKMNNDSIYNIGFIDMTEEIYIPYLNYNTIYLKPVTANSQWNHDVFSYTYEDDADVFVQGTQKWKVTGTGNLKTPYGTYNDVKKVSRYIHYTFSMFGIVIAEVEFIEIGYYDEDFTKPLLSFNYNDYSGSTSGYVYHDDPVTGIEEIARRPVFYPNPATDVVHFSSEVSEFALYSLEGKLVTKEEKRSFLDLASFPKGIYMLEMFANGTLYTEKLKID